MAKSQSSQDKRKASRRSSRNQSRLPWILGGVGVLILIAVPIVINVIRNSSLPGESFPNQGNIHIEFGTEHPAYNSDPPTSGWHTPELNSWGSFDYVVPDERLLHNMEDGGVILWYALASEEENAERIDKLAEVSRGYERVVITPREGMPTTYAMTAWQRLQRFDAIDEEGMQAFLEAYEGVDHHARF